MKTAVRVGIVVLVAAVWGCLAFMAGRYSYLITVPEVFLNRSEKWAVKKARQYAIETGVSEDRLKDPRVFETVRVCFGGMGGMGGVEVTMMRENGQLLQYAW